MGFALGATFVGGVAVATTSSAKHVKACTTSKGVLALASNKGGCPKGERALALNVRGPKGAKGTKGPKGLRGVRGIQGETGLGAIAATVESTDTVSFANGNLINVSGTDLQLDVGCRANDEAYLDIGGTDDYHVGGDLTFNGTGTPAAHLASNLNGGSQGEPVDSGAAFSYENHDSNDVDVSTVFLSSTSGDSATMSSHMIITVGSVVISVDMFFAVAPTVCSGVAVVVPATIPSG